VPNQDNNTQLLDLNQSQKQQEETRPYEQKPVIHSHIKTIAIVDDITIAAPI